MCWWTTAYTMATEPATLENLNVLHQSDDFIVVNKHWDIRIDSKMWYEKLTLQAQLKHRFPQLADPSTYYGFRSGSHQRWTEYASKWSWVIVSLSLSSSGFVISWTSPPAGLFVSPSTRQQLVGPTAALRTAPSPKPTSLLCVYNHSNGDTYAWLKKDNMFLFVTLSSLIASINTVKLTLTTFFYFQAVHRWPSEVLVFFENKFNSQLLI